LVAFGAAKFKTSEMAVRHVNLTFRLHSQQKSTPNTAKKYVHRPTENLL